jgi:hypothetical protein
MPDYTDVVHRIGWDAIHGEPVFTTHKGPALLIVRADDPTPRVEGPPIWINDIPPSRFWPAWAERRARYVREAV